MYVYKWLYLRQNTSHIAHTNSIFKTVPATQNIGLRKSNIVGERSIQYKLQVIRFESAMIARL